MEKNMTTVENKSTTTETKPITGISPLATKEINSAIASTPSIKMEKKLSELSMGQSGTIKAVLGEGKIRRRLFDMGLTPGTEILMKKRAPLGDPLELLVRGYSLSLRKDEAASIEMEVKIK